MFVDFEKKNDINFDSIQEVIQSFMIINNKLIEDPSLLNTVEEEFMDYQGLTKDDILSSIREASKFFDNDYRMNVIWGYLKRRLPHLGEIEKSVLVIPQSNASDERVFSIIRAHKFDIICLSEKYLDCSIDDKSLEISGYHLIRSDHSFNGKRGSI